MTVESNPIKLGQMIQQARLHKGISLRSLAAMTNIPKSSLNDLERGIVTQRRSDIVARIALALDDNPGEYLAALGKSVDEDFPSIDAYLKVRYHHLSPEGIADVQAYVERVALREALD